MKILTKKQTISYSKSIKLLGKISSKWPNDLLGISVYKNLECYC